jgi:hypothetical protein
MQVANHRQIVTVAIGWGKRMAQSEDHLRKRLAAELDNLVETFLELEAELGRDAFRAEYERIIDAELRSFGDDIYNYVVVLMDLKKCSRLVASAALVAFRLSNPGYEVVLPGPRN